MSSRYHHTQIGWFMIAAFGSTPVIIGILMALYGFNWIALAVLVIDGICLVLSPTLTVKIDGEALAIRFGPGIIRKRFPLAEIESCRAVRNRWWYGWGIRWWWDGKGIRWWASGGWLYNVSGLSAVEIAMKDGRRYRIGTDQPAELEAAIRVSIQSAAT